MIERKHGGNPTVGHSHQIINLGRTGEGRTSKPQDPEKLVQEMREIEGQSRRARRFNRG